MIRLYASIVFIFLMAFWAMTLDAQQYVFKSYRQADGLGNLSVQALTVDGRGFLWVATQNGLYRFLGAGFQKITASRGIAEQEVSDVYAAPDGTVWAGTLKNLYRWTGEAFVPAGPTPLPIEDQAQLASESPGHLLAVVGGRLHRLVYGPDGRLSAFGEALPATLTAAHPALADIASVVALPDGAIWMGCGKGLCAWRGGKLTEWGRSRGVPDEVFQSILQGLDGAIWAVSLHHVIELPPGGPAFLDHTPPGGDPSAFYARLPLAMDGQGRVLIAAEGGVARWETSHWRRIGEPNGLSSSRITAIVFDASGDAWLGSTGHGLHHWTGYQNWEGWTERQGLPSANIWSVGLFDSTHAYIGTAKGPASVDPATGEVTSLSSASKWTYGQINGMAQDPEGFLWAGTKSGVVLRVSPRARQVTQIARLPAFIYGMTRDPRGFIFALTGKGVYRVDHLSPGAAPTPMAEVNALFRAVPRVYGGCVVGADTTWFLTDRGLLQLKADQWSRPATAGATLPYLRYISARAIDGGVWLASEEGEIWHVSPTGGAPRATRLALPERYGSLEVVGVASDSRGWVWIGTDDGLLAWNGRAWRHLTQESGLIWNDVNGAGVAGGPDGSIWIGTSGGLGRIMHAERLFDISPPSVSLISIHRGDMTLPLRMNAPLPWSRSDLSFHYAMPSALDREELTFQYRIPQIEPAWTETQDTHAHFAALPGGRYTFEVAAFNRAQDARSAVLLVGFAILPPWWETIWFRILCVAAAALLLYLAYRLRLRHLVLQRRRLEALVLERTQALEASEAKLRIQATHDGLTGLLNRDAILARLDAEMERGAREKTALVIILADLDHFKRINDTHGHLAGDEALRQFGKVLSSHVRPYDYVGRYGGEEFIIVLTGVQNAQVETRLAALHALFTNLAVRHGEAEFVVTCSMGAVYIDPHSNRSPHQIVLEAADKALYEAKRSGRNRFVSVSM